MKRIFINSDGSKVESERKIKVLKLISVTNSDYFEGKNHD